MSRSALDRGLGNVQKRALEAQALIESCREEGEAAAISPLPQTGSTENFNLNTMLYKNVTESAYFLKVCREVRDFSALVDEIYYRVENVEPWAQGGNKIPSSFICCLVRLGLMRINVSASSQSNVSARESNLLP